MYVFQVVREVLGECYVNIYIVGDIVVIFGGCRFKWFFCFNFYLGKVQDGVWSDWWFVGYIKCGVVVKKIVDWKIDIVDVIVIYVEIVLGFEVKIGCGYYVSFCWECIDVGIFGIGVKIYEGVV